MAKGTVITPDQLSAQWTSASHYLQLNIFNFEAKAAALAVKVFQKSFDLKRMNTSGGSHWPARSPNSRGGHPLMVETGTLKRSITWKRDTNQKKVTIYTAPHAFSSSKRHKGFVYAGVHNDGNSKIPKRQFMGHSTVLDNEIKSIIPMLFKGLP